MVIYIQLSNNCNLREIYMYILLHLCDDKMLPQSEKNDWKILDFIFFLPKQMSIFKIAKHKKNKFNWQWNNIKKYYNLLIQKKKHKHQNTKQAWFVFFWLLIIGGNVWQQVSDLNGYFPYTVCYNYYFFICEKNISMMKIHILFSAHSDTFF